MKRRVKQFFGGREEPSSGADENNNNESKRSKKKLKKKNFLKRIFKISPRSEEPTTRETSSSKKEVTDKSSKRQKSSKSRRKTKSADTNSSIGCRSRKSVKKPKKKKTFMARSAHAINKALHFGNSYSPEASTSKTAPPVVERVEHTVPTPATHRQSTKEVIAVVPGSLKEEKPSTKDPSEVSRKARKDKSRSREGEKRKDKSRSKDGEKRKSRSKDSDGSTSRKSTARKQRTSESTSSSDDEESFTDSIKATFRTFRKNRARDFHTVKTFISQPYRDKSMQKMLTRLQQRKKRLEDEASHATPSESHPIQSGVDAVLPKATQHCNTIEDYFPQRRVHGTSPALTPAPAVAAATSELPVTQPAVTQESSPKKVLPPVSPLVSSPFVKTRSSDEDDFKKKYPPVLTNKTNNGKLFTRSNRPFWMVKEDDDDEDESTDNELPMNADLIVDVHEGRIRLTDMPSTPITLNPFAPLEELKARDDVFFSKEILFSNTVRTMINLNDEVSETGIKTNSQNKDEKPTKKSRKKKSKSPKSGQNKKQARPTFEEPTHVHLYDRANPGKMLKKVTIKEFRAKCQKYNVN